MNSPLDTGWDKLNSFLVRLRGGVGGGLTDSPSSRSWDGGEMKGTRDW